MWEESLKTKLEREIHSRINGVSYQMTKFNYYFGVKLGSLLLGHSDTLSKTLQKTRLSAAEGQNIASLTVQTLEKLQSDDSSDSFWDRCKVEAKELKIGDPVLPRKRQCPIRYYLGNATAEFPEDAESSYRSVYYEHWITSLVASKHDLSKVTILSTT